MHAVDTNSDGKISFDEFVRIFEIAPGALPAGVQQLVDGSAKVLYDLGLIAEMSTQEPKSKDLGSAGIKTASSWLHRSEVK